MKWEWSEYQWSSKVKPYVRKLSNSKWPITRDCDAKEDHFRIFENAKIGKERIEKKLSTNHNDTHLYSSIQLWNIRTWFDYTKIIQRISLLNG